MLFVTCPNSGSVEHKQATADVKRTLDYFTRESRWNVISLTSFMYSLAIGPFYDNLFCIGPICDNYFIEVQFVTTILLTSNLWYLFCLGSFCDIYFMLPVVIEHVTCFVLPTVSTKRKSSSNLCYFLLKCY